MDPIEQLKLNLQEKEYPYFEDIDLQNLLLVNGKNVSKASWRGCLLKAASDDQIKVGSIEVKSSNKDYWNNLAAIYKADYEAEQAALNPTAVSTGYRTSMRRADEI
ncbi:hypothetical protein CLPUN_46170 [Clostridium puniceum]|uniref:Uncharacterized protein n=1 Tax=Clostridium puniceum TaxID=29367 RepID=A0A1S8T5L7_9CLOT|nr:hypothetical protein [Clostridium puniceum]OOM72914.1 hypothetical protein CLPUN_46170 [Clostridium puniceum]